MRETETGQEKIKKICDALRKETLEPAIAKAEQLIQEATEKASLILEEARVRAEKMVDEAKKENEKQKEIYEASLRQTCRQTIDYLKQEIEKNLFQPAIGAVSDESLHSKETLVKIIDAIVLGIEKEGIAGDISAYIADTMPLKEVNAMVAKRVLERLKEKSVLIAPLGEGVEIKMEDAGIKIVVTNSSLKEIMGQFLRKDLREMFFKLDKK